MAQAKRKRSKVEVSSGNVFADLNLPDAEERQTKVQLAVAINRELAAREWSQSEAAEVLGINQPKVHQSSDRGVAKSDLPVDIVNGRLRLCDQCLLRRNLLV